MPLVPDPNLPRHRERRAYGRGLVFLLGLVVAWSLAGAFVYFDHVMHTSQADWQPALGLIGIGEGVFSTFALYAAWTDPL